MSMLNNYNSLCDDFYLDMYLNTKLELPTQRDTILAFFERLQKQFPSMSRFYQPQNSEYCLEEDRSFSQYRWISLEVDRIGSGIANPLSFQDAYDQDKLVLELVPYMLGVSHLDVGSLDVVFSMDFDYAGSHDEIITEALFSSSAFSCLLELPYSRCVGFSPTMVVTLSEDKCTQARISIESKTGVYEPSDERQGEDEAISLAFTVRQYPRTGERFDSLQSFEHQHRLAEEIMAEKIIPHIVHPLTEAIAQRRST